MILPKTMSKYNTNPDLSGDGLILYNAFYNEFRVKRGINNWKSGISRELINSDFKKITEEHKFSLRRVQLIQAKLIQAGEEDLWKEIEKGLIKTGTISKSKPFVPRAEVAALQIELKRKTKEIEELKEGVHNQLVIMYEEMKRMLETNFTQTRNHIDHLERTINERIPKA